MFMWRTTHVRTLVAGVGAGAVVFGGERATRVPVAYHEAGHAIVALHLAEDGMACADGTLRLVGSTPSLLRFATVTPRETDKGQRYIGETKLARRWRHMSSYTSWVAGAGGAAPRVDVPAPHAPGEPPRALLLLARIAYLMGGRAAEDRLRVRSDPVDGAATPAAATAARVAALEARPGTAWGDLRKARQLCASETKAVGVGPAPLLHLGYGYASEVLALRWPQVQALAGALLVRGTVDGGQLEALVAAQRRARGDRPVAGQGSSGQARADAEWLRGLAGCPLLFGAAWAASGECPAREDGPAPSVPRDDDVAWRATPGLASP